MKLTGVLADRRRRWAAFSVLLVRRSDDLAAELGPGWGFTYRGHLDAGKLAAALESVRSNTNGGGPDLSARECPAIGAAHAAAYRQARTAVTRRRNV